MEWMDNFILNFIMDEIIYPCWDWNKCLYKGSPIFNQLVKECEKISMQNIIKEGKISKYLPHVKG